MPEGDESSVYSIAAAVDATAVSYSMLAKSVFEGKIPHTPANEITVGAKQKGQPPTFGIRHADLVAFITNHPEWKRKQAKKAQAAP